MDSLPPIRAILEPTSRDERTGTLGLGHPRPTIAVTATKIPHARAADFLPIVIRDGAPVVVLTTDAPRCGVGVLVWCWDDAADRWRWSGHWVVDGYDWIVTLDKGVLALRDGRAPCVFEEAAE